jgi:penicillin-binding protein-related factor A (putative recombinase)
MSIAEYRRRADSNGMITDDAVAAAAIDAFFGDLGPSPPASPKRASALVNGRRSSIDQSARAINGMVSEDIVGDLHAVCRARGVADMTKIATPMRIRKDLGQGMFVASFAKKSGVDYRGHMLDGTGRGAYVECKSVANADDKFYLRHMRADQIVQLDAAVQAGCVAVLIVIRAGRAYAMPWSFARQHVGLGDVELEPWYVQTGEAYLARWSRSGGNVIRREPEL